MGGSCTEHFLNIRAGRAFFPSPCLLEQYLRAPGAATTHVLERPCRTSWSDLAARPGTRSPLFWNSFAALLE